MASGVGTPDPSTAARPRDGALVLGSDRTPEAQTGNARAARARARPGHGHGRCTACPPMHANAAGPRAALDTSARRHHSCMGKGRQRQAETATL